MKKDTIKYDDLCAYVRKKVGITDDTGGGVVLIIVKRDPVDDHGIGGFAMQADADVNDSLPDLLEWMAAKIREERKRS